MDLKEILSRKSPMFYTTDEACFVVEEYIFQTKNEKIKINLNKKIDPRLKINHPMYQVLMTTQLRNLNQAFLIASERIKI